MNNQEEVVVERKERPLNYTSYHPPYIDFYGEKKTVRVWTPNKKKIVLYYLFQITRIKWFLKKYNE